MIDWKSYGNRPYLSEDIIEKQVSIYDALFKLYDIEPRNLSVLEVGAGHGIRTMIFARLFKKILAIDPSQDLIDLLQKKIKEDGLEDKVKTMVVGCEDMKCNSTKFDLIIMSASFLWVLKNVLKSTNTFFLSKNYLCIVNIQYIAMKRKKKNKDVYTRVKKIILSPNDKQKELLDKWFIQYKDAYNCSIKYIRQLRGSKDIGSQIDLRKKVKPLLEPHILSNKIPSHTIDQAIFDAHKGHHIWQMSKKIRPMRYRKKADNLVIEGLSFSKNFNTYCSSSIGKEIRSTQPIQGITKNSRLSYRNNQYILWVPVEEDKIIDNHKVHRIALDPGLRTFQTGYSSKKEHPEYGNDMKKINYYTTALRRTEENFIKPNTNIDSKNTKRRMKMFKERVRKRIKNIVNDLQWKTARHLAKNYANISIGKFSTIGCVRNSRRDTMGAFNKDKCYHLSHFTFRMRLKFKCEQFGSKYQEVSEYMTSKTCSSCGKKNMSLGSSKTFSCNHCGLNIDRDYNASINIYNKTKW